MRTTGLIISHNQLLCPGRNKYYPIGSIVKILDTPYSQTHIPDHIGQEGEVVSLPLHPNIFYHLRIDGAEETVKVQANCLELIKEGTIVNPTSVYIYNNNNKLLLNRCLK